MKGNERFMLKELDIADIKVGSRHRKDMGDLATLELKQHPCQKPVAVMRWLIHALSEPGEMVCSPFCGVAPCGALQ
jgi:DNA modification methylase